MYIYVCVHKIYIYMYVCFICTSVRTRYCVPFLSVYTYVHREHVHGLTRLHGSLADTWCSRFVARPCYDNQTWRTSVEKERGAGGRREGKGLIAMPLHCRNPVRLSPLPACKHRWRSSTSILRCSTTVPVIFISFLFMLRSMLIFDCIEGFF